MTPLIKQMLEANLEKEIEERLANPNLLDCQKLYDQLCSLHTRTDGALSNSISTITSMIKERGGYAYGK
jgi:hypothetical protein